MKRVEIEMKALGFKKRGSNFLIDSSDNFGIISFQKSRHSSQEHLLFTIEIGVCSKKLLDFLNPRFLNKPSIENCHWRERIGFLMKEPHDHWWKIDELTDLDNVYSEIQELLLQKGVPEIFKHISDENLERIWLSGTSNGLTEFERLIYLTSLLKIYNRSNLKEVAMALKIYSIDKQVEDTAEQHIRRLGVKF
jgi:hypothetical protein